MRAMFHVELRGRQEKSQHAKAAVSVYGRHAMGWVGGPKAPSGSDESSMRQGPVPRGGVEFGGVAGGRRYMVWKTSDRRAWFRKSGAYGRPPG
jgi:hypothetical protein